MIDVIFYFTLTHFMIVGKEARRYRYRSVVGKVKRCFSEIFTYGLILGHVARNFYTEQKEGRKSVKKVLYQIFRITLKGRKTIKP